MSRKNIVILGSTGSIGQNTLQVIEAFPERFNVLGLAAAKNTELLLEQARKFRPKYCCLMFEESFRGYEAQFKETGCELLWGKEGYKTLASMNEADIVVSSMVGAAGLIPTISAVEAGKTVALANKESLVIGGELVMSIAKRTGAQIFPVDSEHSAVFQCLNGEDKAKIHNIILTASGGPFWDRSLEEMENARVEDALNHPNWSMGAKITVDSATMMNKGLEVIEARWLFDVDVEKIKVLIHRQSIVHSMVEFKDGAIMAQLGSPDMRIPIAYALSWPERLALEVKRVSFTDIARLTFEQPDFERFPLLRLGYEAAKRGGSYSVALNAANELAVEAYLARRIRFGAIQKVVSGVLEKIEQRDCKSLDEILYWDSLARLYAEDMIGRTES
ncbi:1-deoxy-D-xylulose 5-phosphate reductoisomerase [Dissulfuribacter thermophilus]|uniref:1-deoxy-D-xylulose 5-phosphate reductoisomerase n=1 Tax=Dissulfuribacter thermophilus TaxID=1156395 RepID=A0A1B9F812_9BACT|nr:1-deoxy-D-xylulose-5-phosphate reductoisomerase [Dissulfuribacter thermophilus]OCC16040.1 1-deoxy-D-xylulose 5-phosphate reductoisomerase [Dissulfuribacter thermophilus]